MIGRETANNNLGDFQDRLIEKFKIALRNIANKDGALAATSTHSEMNEMAEIDFELYAIEELKRALELQYGTEQKSELNFLKALSEKLDAREEKLRIQKFIQTRADTSPHSMEISSSDESNFSSAETIDIGKISGSQLTFFGIFSHDVVIEHEYDIDMEFNGQHQTASNS